jgi:hypothetical protein
VLPEAGSQLREELERVVAEDLAADACGMFFEQVDARDFFREDFRQAAAGELRRAIDPLRMSESEPILVCTHDHVEPRRGLHR